jgi:hypothetical protein
MSDINRKRMIPLHIADQAVAACDAEIAKLKEENARLKAEVDNLRKSAEINPTQSTHDDDTCPHLVVLGRLEAENARFKAEAERLTAFTTRTIIPNEELQAQVERLTKAGDAVCESPYALETDPAVIAWRAAKEGKQP